MLPGQALSPGMASLPLPSPSRIAPPYSPMLLVPEAEARSPALLLPPEVLTAVFDLAVRSIDDLSLRIPFLQVVALVCRIWHGPAHRLLMRRLVVPSNARAAQILARLDATSSALVRALTVAIAPEISLPHARGWGTSIPQLCHRFAARLTTLHIDLGTWDRMQCMEAIPDWERTYRAIESALPHLSALERFVASSNCPSASYRAPWVCLDLSQLPRTVHTVELERVTVGKQAGLWNWVGVPYEPLPVCGGLRKLRINEASMHPLDVHALMEASADTLEDLTFSCHWAPGEAAGVEVPAIVQGVTDVLETTLTFPALKSFHGCWSSDVWAPFLDHLTQVWIGQTSPQFRTIGIHFDDFHQFGEMDPFDVVPLGAQDIHLSLCVPRNGVVEEDDFYPSFLCPIKPCRVDNLQHLRCTRWRDDSSRAGGQSHWAADLRRRWNRSPRDLDWFNLLDRGDLLMQDGSSLTFSQFCDLNGIALEYGPDAEWCDWLPKTPL